MTAKHEERPEATYEEMDMRQKGLVDAIALNNIEGRGLTNEEVRELAHELSGEKQYAEDTTVSKYRKRYPHVIDEREQMLANERNGEGGEVTTIGDPMRQYTGDPEGIDATMQNIQDRPVKQAGDDADPPLMLLPVDRDRLFKLLRAEDEEVARWAFDKLLGEAD